MGMSSRRAERVADLLQEILAKLLREDLRDPRLGFATVTDVRVSRDLKVARVFVALHGDDDERARSLEALLRARPFFRREIARRTRLRQAPELRIEEDEALERGMRIEEILDRLREGSDRESE